MTNNLPVKKDNKLNKTKDIVRDTILALVIYPDRKSQSEYLGISEDGLQWRLRNYPAIKKTINDIPEEAKMRLKAGTLRAVEVFLRGLDNPEKEMEAAKEICDRAGVSKQTKQHIEKEEKILIINLNKDV